MTTNVFIAIRLRLALSQLVLDAQQGVYSNSADVLATPSSLVVAGWPETPKQKRVYLMPGGDEEGRETPRSDGPMRVAVFDECMTEAMLILEAVGRDLRHPSKGCIVPTPPPRSQIKQLYMTSRGAPVHETTGKRYWRADGDIDVIWAVQPNT